MLKNFDSSSISAIYSRPSTVLLLICLVLIINLARNKFRPGLRTIPGPALAAYTSLWRWHDVRTGQAHKSAINIHKKYGPLVRIGPNHVSISDPREIKNIYSLKSGYTKVLEHSDFLPLVQLSTNMCKTAFYPIQSILWRGKIEVNLFSTRDEAYHLEMKKPVAISYNLSTLLANEPAIDSCSELFFKKLADFADQRKPVDLGKWIQFYTFDVIGELTFAKKLGFLKTGTDVDDIINTIENLLAYAAQIGQIPIWHKFLLGNPLLPYLIPSMENWNQVLAFTLKAVNSVLGVSEGVEGGLKKGGELDAEGRLNQRGDMLSKWYAIKLATPERMSTRDIVVQLSSNIFAGSDTTAIAIRAVIYHLLKDPTKMQKIVREIDEAVAKEYLSQPISFKESTNRLPYMQAAIKEGIRIHPSVGLLLERHVPKGGANICGKHIPGGTIVGINAWVTQHDPDVFFNPESFIPERWLDASEEELKIMDQSFFAFGGGTRTCIGRHIAIIEMAKIIPELLRRFEITLTDPQAEWKVKNYWFVQQEGFICNLKRRNL